MKIDIIYIACYRRDYRMTRILVASIRHWYLDIPITLIKDEMMRNFDTSELEQSFNVSVFPQHTRIYGWGFSKLEIFFQKEKKRFLLLDSDIIMAGPILEIFEKFNEDFVVHDETFVPEEMHKWYFIPEEVEKLDPEFRFPKYTFNTGQIVGSTGILKRSDFEQFIEFSSPRKIKFPHAFPFINEQPVLNYVLMKKLQLDEITKVRFNFMREGGHPDTDAINIENLEQKKGYSFVVHWHDKKPEIFHPKMKKIPNKRLLHYFEKKYYKRLGLNSFQHYLRIRNEYLEDKMFMTGIKLYSWLKKVK